MTRPTRATTQVAQKLVDDKVVAVIGHLNSGTSIPASKIYSDAGIVQISPSATNPTYTQQGFKTTYRVVATDAQQAGTRELRAVEGREDRGGDRRFDRVRPGLANEFEKKAKALGLKVLSHDATNDKAVDFRAILTKVKGENPDAIMYGGMDATGGPLAKQAKQLGLRAKILSGDGVCTDSLADRPGGRQRDVLAGRRCAREDAGRRGLPREVPEALQPGHQVRCAVRV